MDMIERVARALERVENPQWTDEQFETWWERDPFFCITVTSWGYFTGTRKERCLYNARVIVEAMRNPTMGMMIAARNDHEGEHFLPHSLFNSMIDAALAASKK